MLEEFWVPGEESLEALLKEIQSGKRKVDLLEVMACPDGCINGGGQPLPVDDKVLRIRSRAVYDIDNGSKLHTAHQSPAIQKIYQEILGEPGGEKSRDLFNTSYTRREVLL